MKICAACHEELPQESFSKKQWQMKRYRRCKGCIDVDRSVQLKAPPTKEPNRDVRGEPTPPPGASCWLCLEEDSNESGHPLRRDCSCRGDDAGFAHLPCLVGYAQHKTEHWDGKDIEKFTEPWVYCLNCHQRHQNTLSVELAAEFVVFVEKNYPGDQTKLVEALFEKMDALKQNTQPRAATEAGARILSAIDQMKASNHLLSRRTVQIELITHHRLGAVYFEERTKESDKAALVHFERCRELCIELKCPAEYLARIEESVAAAKRRSGGDSTQRENVEERLKSRRSWYNTRVALNSEGHPDTIQAGLKLALALRLAKQVVEAERLLAELLATCKRVHGPDHSLTKKVESRLGTDA